MVFTCTINGRYLNFETSIRNQCMFQHLSQKFPYKKHRKLIVSFHDVSPISHVLCTDFLERLYDIGIQQTSLLVVPCWHNVYPMAADTGFISWLRSMTSQGHELCLHGFSHISDSQKTTPTLFSWFIANVYTNGEGEFLFIDKLNAAQKIASGLDAFKIITAPIHGFIPPAWLLSTEGRRAAKNAGFQYTTTLNHIDFLQRDYRVYAPTVVFSCRNAWRRLISCFWLPLWFSLNRTTPILRIAVHPQDLKFSHIRRTLLTFIRAARARRLPITYRDLLQNDFDCGY